jgi:hypothetical protein
MAHRAHEGDTHRLAGGYGGAVFFHGKWQRFSCMLCLREQVAPTVVHMVQPTQRAAEVALHGPKAFGCLGADAHRLALGRKS